MIDTLRRICALQPSYSSENTPAMQERGRLIRQELPQELSRLRPQLVTALGSFGSELAFGSSDGIGRKTEAPWVRIYSQTMSPTPRAGFYVVIHFAANGSAVFLTLGCGSTIWANGDLRPETDTELNRRTEWARQIIREEFGSTTPFEPVMNLNAKAPLPKTFEKATALAYRVPVGDLEERVVEEFIILLTTWLRAIYEAQRIGRNLSGGAVAELTVEQIVTPARGQVFSQGFGLSPGERRAVELRAMQLARAWLAAEGFHVTDVSATSSYDFEAKRAEEVMKIEVKGTTSDTADAVLMTRREVELHQTEKGSTGLIVVSGIRLQHRGQELTADGGVVHADLGWDIDTWEAAPLAFRLTRRATESEAT